MSDSSEGDFNAELPPEITEAAKKAVFQTLPQKSQRKYNEAYITFTTWMKTNKIQNVAVTETILLAYVTFLSENKKYKPATIVSIISMIKHMIMVKHNVDISQYKQLQRSLKTCMVGYVAKKSKVLNAEDFKNFLENAPDNKYLAAKVITVIGVLGACRKNEMIGMKITDIRSYDDLIHVTIPDTKTHVPRSFTVIGEYHKIVQKYLELRPKDITNDRFFINYQNGKCSRQVIGKNKIGKVPFEIAQFLKLPEPQLYTGHCFRRTSATLLANSGASLTMIKQLGGWKSSTTAKGYLEASLESKKAIETKLTSSINLSASTSTKRKIDDVEPAVASDKNPQNLEDLEIAKDGNSYYFSNCQVSFTK